MKQKQKGLPSQLDRGRGYSVSGLGGGGEVYPQCGNKLSATYGRISCSVSGFSQFFFGGGGGGGGGGGSISILSG